MLCRCQLRLLLIHGRSSSGGGGGIGVCNLLPQLDDLPLHFRIAAAFAYPLEVRLDFALELETATPRARREGILNDIAPEL